LVALLACGVVFEVEMLQGPGVLTIKMGKAPHFLFQIGTNRFASDKQHNKLKVWVI
jgi:hypothetical protein